MKNRPRTDVKCACAAVWYLAAANLCVRTILQSKDVGLGQTHGDAAREFVSSMKIG